jgi:hypothetical protein
MMTQASNWGWRGLITLVAAAVLAFWPEPADAAFQLRLTNGASSVTLTDDNLGDLDAGSGRILFSGGVGDFLLNLTFAWTKPYLGSATIPRLELFSVDASSLTGGILTIEMTETGFTGTPGGLTDVGFLTAIGGTTQGSVSISTFTGLNEFDQTTPLGTAGPFGTGVGTTVPFSASFVNNPAVDLTAPFSLTTVVTVVHPNDPSSSDGPITTSFNASVEALPEPGSILVWGGLVAAAVVGTSTRGVFRRRRSGKV